MKEKNLSEEDLGKELSAMRNRIAELEALETKHNQIKDEINRDYNMQSTISSLLQISLKPITLKDQLEQALDLIIAIPWLVLESQGCIYLVENEPNVLVMKAQRGFRKVLQSSCKSVPFGKCLCGRAASSGEIVFADCVDDRHDTQYQDMPPHGHYCVPIMSGERMLGIINLYVRHGHKRDKKEDEFLLSVANTLAGIIERKQADEKLKLYSQHLEELVEERTGKLLKTMEHLKNEIAERKKAERGLKESEARYRDIVKRIFAVVCELSPEGTILFVNDAVLSITGYNPDDLIGKNWWNVFYPEEHRHQVDKLYQMFQIKDVTNYEMVLMAKDGSYKTLDISSSNRYNQDGTLKHIVFFGVDITGRVQLREALRVMSLIDDLTSLYNRRGFFTLAHQQLSIAERKKMSMLLFYIDLNDLKSINHKLGYSEGNRALLDVANILRKTFRQSDIFARIGKDEFAVLVLDASKTNEKIIINRLKKNLNAINETQNRLYNLLLTLGIMHYTPENTFSLDDFIAKADRLMDKRNQTKIEKVNSLSIIPF